MTTTLHEPPALREVRPGDAVVPALARLLADAYPVLAIDSPEALARHTVRIDEMAGEAQTRWVVAEDGSDVIAAMRLHDFTMNVRGRDALVGGVGSVAVARTHKRRGLARTLVRAYLDRYRAQGAPFAALHPFRLDFYRRLGFGYGTPVHRYSFTPAAIHAAPARALVRALGPGDVDAFLACSERVRRATHGQIAKLAGPARAALEHPAHAWVGAERDGVLRGYAQTDVILGSKGTHNRNALVVRELGVEDADAQAALLGYLHGQRDAFARIVIESQDSALFLAAADPRDGCDRYVSPPAAHRVAETGLGIMYRLVDAAAAFATLPPSEPRFVLRVELADAWYGDTAGTWTLAFERDGVRAAQGAPDASLRIGSGDCASLVLGALTLGDLLRYGLAEVDPPSAATRVAQLFAIERPPQTVTRF